MSPWVELTHCYRTILTGHVKYNWGDKEEQAISIYDIMCVLLLYYSLRFKERIYFASLEHVLSTS